MKLLIISDIHSNIDNLDAVLKHEQDADRKYCSGDVVDVGFHPCRVIDRLRERDILCVRGNHDDKVVERWRTCMDPAVPPGNFLDLNAQMLDESRINWLAALPERMVFSHDGISYLMQHRWRGYELLPSDYAFDALWADAPVDPKARHRCIIFGHTHHQSLTWLAADRCWINPGSIGYNRDHDPFPGTRYMTIVDGLIHFHRLEHSSWMSRSDLQRHFQNLNLDLTQERKTQ